MKTACGVGNYLRTSKRGDPAPLTKRFALGGVLHHFDVAPHLDPYESCSVLVTYDDASGLHRQLSLYVSGYHLMESSRSISFRISHILELYALFVANPLVRDIKVKEDSGHFDHLSP